VSVPALERRAALDWRSEIRRFGSVVCLSTADMDAPLWTNKQHVATRLAQEVPTLYVESLGLRAPRLSRRDLQRIRARLRRRITDPTPGPNWPTGLEVASPLVVPFYRAPGVPSTNRLLLNRQLRSRIKELPTPRLLWAYSPIAAWFVDSGDFDAVVYHCVDDLATQPRMPAQFIRTLEGQLARSADAVFASAPALRERLLPFNTNTHFTPNVCDWDHFALAAAPGPIPAEMQRIPHPRAIFVGALSDYKIDWELLDRVAAVLPEWSFVFVGPRGEETKMTGWRRLARRTNCHFLGYQPLERVPDFMRGADIALLPYILSEHTRGVFPLKAIEYLAAGLPIVSTRLPSLISQLDLPVYYAGSADEFVDGVRRVDRTEEAARARTAAASLRTWDDLLGQMFGVLAERSRP
jgi:glycosyltransferase involved in cell wall biosynthesis